MSIIEIYMATPQKYGQTIIVSCSIDKELYNFAKETGLNLSRVLRTALMEIRDRYDNEEDLEKALNTHKKKIQMLAEYNEKYMNFLNERGLIDEFLKKNG